MAYAADWPGSRGRSFRAKYHSACAACPENIFPGELVHFVDDDLCHVVCDTEVDRLADTPPCPRCFTIPSATDTCLCED